LFCSVVSVSPLGTGLLRSWPCFRRPAGTLV